MNYLPPPLNDSASAAVKKADTTLHGIQVALAQATRPIDYYVHRRIHDNPQVNEIDLHILFASTMRVLLKARRPHIQQETREAPQDSQALSRAPAIWYEKRPPHLTTTPRSQIFAVKAAALEGDLNRSHVRPPDRGPPRDVPLCMGQNYGQPLGPQNRRERIADCVQEEGTNGEGFGGEPIKYFCRAGPIGWPKVIQAWPVSTKRLERFDNEAATQTAVEWTSAADAPPAVIQEEDGRRRTFRTDGGSRLATIKERDRTGENTEPGILQHLVCNSKEDRGTQTSPGLEESESSRKRAELQDGIIDIDLSPNSQKGFNDFPGSGGCVHAHPDPRILQKLHPLLLEWTVLPVPIDMGEVNGNQNNCVPRRPTHSRRIEGPMFVEYGPGVSQAPRAWVRNQAGEISNYSVRVHNPPGYDNQFLRDDTEGTFFQGQGPPKGSCKDFESGINDIEIPFQLYRQSTSDVDSITAWPINVEETIRVEEQISFEDEFMDIDCYTDRAGSPESVILGTQIEGMER
ncbi:hypothetical protein AYI69_g11079, partial [Smittium culicis]